MPTPRTTAVVQFILPSNSAREALPLATEREFTVTLAIDGHDVASKSFFSPLNDAMWRDFLSALSKCNTERSLDNYDQARNIRNVGRSLYTALSGLSPVLAAFLDRADTPRRLVIQTRRPELHLLPWAALVDNRGKLLAAGDLSIVQTWDTFNLAEPYRFKDSINLVEDFGSDTQKRTLAALAKLPPEITRDPLGSRDILHMEEHGDRILNQIGGVDAPHLLALYKDTRLALLWSCYSGSGGNSWGDSPALILHRGGDATAPGDGAAMVLSFQAELHYSDAKSISEDFYADVFGPAATRDPESALVRIRAARFDDEFEFANWASMTVYLRQPLDLSALPLNGPRVPAALWLDDPASLAPAESTLVAAFNSIAETVAHLQPGTTSTSDALDARPENEALPLPAALLKPWRGNVIRLAGALDPLSDDTIRQLNLNPKSAPATRDADRLIWFFDQIRHFGAPLIVWTNCRPHHVEFLSTIAPDASLTFLLLFGPEPTRSIPDLVDLNRLGEARDQYDHTSTSDADHVAAYFAFARGSKRAEAEQCLARLKSPFERLLLSGNFVSRFGVIPDTPSSDTPSGTPPPVDKLAPGTTVEGLKRQHSEEDFYREAIDAAAGDSLQRDRGRARHELAYYQQCQKRSGAARLLYRMALEDLERSRDTAGDLLWNAAFANTLRDWADLESSCLENQDQAKALLARALAIHSFHGRKLQIAYSLTTRARIALTACNTRQAIDDAVDSANRFEQCDNWVGWVAAIGLLLDALADKRETTRMLNLIQMAADKLRHTDLTSDKLTAFNRTLQFRKAEAHWIEGSLAEARAELDNLAREARAADSSYPSSDLAQQIDRLTRFLHVGKPAR